MKTRSSPLLGEMGNFWREKTVKAPLFLEERWGTSPRDGGHPQKGLKTSPQQRETPHPPPKIASISPCGTHRCKHGSGSAANVKKRKIATEKMGNMNKKPPPEQKSPIFRRCSPSFQKGSESKCTLPVLRSVQPRFTPAEHTEER